MPFRRRMRRRRGGLRWFTPNVWSASSGITTNVALGITTPVFEVTGAGTDRNLNDIGICPLIKGGPPLPAAVNAAGREAGGQLAERQWWRVLRIVGRLAFQFVWTEAELVLTLPMFLTINWAICRLHIDEAGAADTPLPNLRARDTQDEKAIILAQDVWRHQFGTGHTFDPSSVEVVGSSPPLFSMIDIKTRRSLRNEQDLFLIWDASLFSPSNQIPTTSFESFLSPLVNLRTLGKFGR